MEASQVNVLVPVPTSSDVVVCDLADLLDHLEDGDTLYEVMENVGFDTLNDLSELPALLGRVRQLNHDGDAAKYWGLG